jgi:hypothetical protein
MSPPLATFLNGTQVRISWDPESFHHGGPISRYEIRISYQRTGNVHNISVSANESSHVSVALDKISAEQVKRKLP